MKKTIIVVGAGQTTPRVIDIIKDKITSSNNKYTVHPSGSPKSCPHCGGSPTEKREGQGFCQYCDRYF